MTLLQTTSLSNQNISSALSIATYTSDAERLLIIDVSLDQIVGSGDYKAYITRQRAGSGSEFVSAITTDSVGAVTNHLFGSTIIAVNSTDVIKVYVIGLAGDTTTPDTIVEFWDMAVPSSQNYTSARAAKLDYLDAAITSRSTYDGSDTSGITTLLSRISQALQFTGANVDVHIQGADSAVVIPRVTLVDTTTDLTNAGTVTISDGDMTTIAQRNWNSVYVPVRTLSQPSASVISAVTGTDISVYAYSTIDFTLTGLSSLSGWKRVWFSVKKARTNSDAESLLQLMVSNPASAVNDGLIYINKVKQTVQTTGSITVLDSTSIQVHIDESVNTLSPQTDVYYDVKAEMSDDSIVIISDGGRFSIVTPITRDI